MRVALAGKGGSGKTTAASLLIRALVERRKAVLAIDADINQHLAETLCLPREAIDATPELGNALPQLKALLRGSNRLIPSLSAMVKTTPPGPGSRLTSLTAEDPVLSQFAYCHETLMFLRVGGFTDMDLGARCFHAKTGAAELVLNHLVDKPDDWVVADMTAGADAFASGLFTRFDLTVLVVEPTPKSLGVWQQYKDYALKYDVAIRVLGNKVENGDDVALLRATCCEDLIGWLRRSSWVRHTERGTRAPFAALEKPNKAAIDAVIDTAGRQHRDWRQYWRWAVHFHVKNAESWANAAVGHDVTRQIDQAFLENLAARLDDDAQATTRLPRRFPPLTEGPGWPHGV
jgi:CO dehydrogenase maturation factor